MAAPLASTLRSVGLLVHDLTRAGAQQVVYHLATLLDPSKFHSRAYGLRDGELAADLRAHGVPVNILKQRVPYFDPTVAMHLRRVLRKDGIELLHTHLFGADLHGSVAVAFQPQVGVVSTVHSDRFDNWRQKLVAGMVLRRASRVVTVGSGIAKRLIISYPQLALKVRVIPNGVEPLPVSPEVQERARAALSLPKDCLAIGTLGRLTKEKSHKDLLLAFRAVRRHSPSARLVILGEGPLHMDLEAQCKALDIADSVSLPGNLPGARSLLPAFDIFVLSSLWEGLPMALLEAMMAGVACVTTRVGSVPDVLQDGITGIMAPPSDPESLARALLELLRDHELRVRLGSAARREAMQRFTARRMVEAYERLYEEVLAEKR